jgi:hypothetical protein
MGGLRIIAENLADLPNHDFQNRVSDNLRQVYDSAGEPVLTLLLRIQAWIYRSNRPVLAPNLSICAS